ncbi:MAG: putative baseplate assembly protein [Candidatus Competibacteraceae bacterium]
MIYFCLDQRRRAAVLNHATLNGIDFLEVVGDQRTLQVHFLKVLTGVTLRKDNLRIEGGVRIRDVAVSSDPVIKPGSQVLEVAVNKAGDFSLYILRIVQGPDSDAPPPGLDPKLAAIEFSFKAALPSDFDCQAERICPTEAPSQPDINYLAKDYASFRQLMLDRLATVLPDWRERTPADLGIALVELLAYVGDYLSYQQDAVATEAYLGTARRRISVRRHARLVDYRMHDGANARVWVQVCVSADGVKLIQKNTTFLTRIPTQPLRLAPGSAAYMEALAAQPVVFEPLHDITLYRAHNEIEFYTWGDDRCCLPRGATRATLKNSGNQLKQLTAGDVLIFLEKYNPQNGSEQEADPTHRHAVRLTKVTTATDPLFKDTDGKPLRVLDIEWAAEDALPFPLCLWEVEVAVKVKKPVSIALGNVVLADHGQTFVDKKDASSLVPATVPQNPLRYRLPATVPQNPLRYRPRLLRAPLTHAAPYDKEAPAQTTLGGSPSESIPAIKLQVQSTSPVEIWKPEPDLLNRGPQDKAFVVEIETDDAAWLRFGDDQCGACPVEASQFLATYRIGNGVQGNVGAETIAHIVTAETAITRVWNPLPARGGSEPESIQQVRQNAPNAFRTQERAATPDDYADIARRCDPDIQRAVATLRWTGSWHTVFLTVDRLGGRDVDAAYETTLRRCLERYRLAGYDLEVDGPRYVSLDIWMWVVVTPNYFTSDVKAELLRLFSNQLLPDGRRGVFHPDNFSFGQTVFLSPLYAAALTVAGVDSVKITRFQRQGINSDEALQAGELKLNRLEIARLDNDPNFPEHGVFTLFMEGGR